MSNDKPKIALAAVLTIFAAPASLAQEAPPPATETADEIVVTGQRGAINRARAAERDSQSLANVVTSDTIGQFPDQNVSESVRRVPGVNVSRNEGEGRTISVRGLPPSFTTVTVNGARVGSVDSGTGEVQLDSVGSELLDQIKVVKAITPDMDGDSIGGSVDISSLSALKRGENSFTAGVEGYYNSYSEGTTPEGSLSFTRLFFGNSLGIAGALSYSKRDVTGYELINDEGLTPFADIQPTLGLTGLRPDEIDSRAEIGTRQRYGATLNIEWRQDPNNLAFARLQYTRLDDDDGRYQNEYETDQADRIDELNQGPIGPGFAYLGFRPPTTRTTGGPDIDKQIRLSEFTDEVFASSFGTTHDLGDWEIGWQFDYSLARALNPEGYRTRFRIRNISLDTRFGETTTTVLPIAVGDRDPADPADYVFDSLLAFDFKREDEIVTLSGDIRRDLALGDVKGFVEVGGRYRARDKDSDNNQRNMNPQDAIFNAVPGIATLRGALSTLPLMTIDSTHEAMRLFPQRDALWARMRGTDAALRGLVAQQPVESLGEDFRVDERTAAGYVMGRLEVTPSLAVLGGVRVEDTELETQGFFIEVDDNQAVPVGSPGILDLGIKNRTFTEALPSIHLLWNPSTRIDVRASYNRGLQKPDFDDFSNRIRINATNRNVAAGNPTLEPLMADNFDVAVGWYPNGNTAFQAGVFYKSIDNFFIDYDGPFAFAGNPVTLPAGTVTVPGNLEVTLNGDKATLVGVEVAYSQNYTFLPGFLSGLFTQANVTWIDSEAKTFVRPNETFTLPRQPDLLANLSLGWENDVVTVRVAGNYVGEAIETLSAPTAVYQDTYRNDYVSLDLTARVKVASRVQITFEGSNLTEENDEVVFRGTPQTGRLFQLIEDYGRTFTIGVRALF